MGKKGCVMTGDKRKIGYFGDKEKLGELEKELYSGEIETDEDLLNRSNELGISIKITDDANKLKIVGNTVRGEVSTKGTFETKRRRIYGTTNGYQIVELLGSETSSRNVFEDILKEVSSKTPTVGSKFDTLIQQPQFDKTQAQKHLNITIDNDIKVLIKFRQDLTEKLVQQSIAIDMANKIIDKGEVGKVVSIDGNMLYVQLNNKTQAMDGNWKQLAAPGQNVLMFTDTDDVKVGDKVIIEDENLCLKRNKSSLKCDIILCSL